MSKRSQEKRITQHSRALKFLREQSKLSLRKVAALTGYGDTLIHHLEHGRVDIHSRHLEKLLPVYGTTPQMFEMFASGQLTLPQNLRGECIEIIKTMPLEHLRTAHPVLASLANQAKGGR